jgi:hypothetical protein
MEGENEITATEAAEIAEAAASMGEEVGARTSSGRGMTPNVSAHDDGDDADQEVRAPEEVEADEPVDEPAPDFWSADDKAAWTGVPAELRPVLRKYEQQRVEFVNEKAREADAIRTQAAEEVRRARAGVEQAAAFWQQAAPALQKAFLDKWSHVNWAELAEKDPKEWARLNQQRLDEAALLAEADRRGEADRQAALQRAEQDFQTARRTEQAKLASKLPDWFGTPDIAQKTMEGLRSFLFAKGIRPERIDAIYEAPIIELALNAWRFEHARQLALRSSARAKEGRPTPTRVAPGPGGASRRAGNRQSDAAQQAGERFRKSGGDSIADAAELIRLSGL